MELDAQHRRGGGLPAPSARLPGYENRVRAVQPLRDGRVATVVGAGSEEAGRLELAAVLHPHLVNLIARELWHPLHTEDARAPVTLQDPCGLGGIWHRLRLECRGTAAV